MTIDLKKFKDLLTPKYIAIGVGVLVVLGIFAIALISVIFPRQAIAQAPPTATETIIEPTPTQMPTPLPTLAPPAPTPVSTHYVSWTNRETGIYLREKPGSTLILDAIPNGDEVARTGGQPVIYGGMEWIETSYLGQSGWIATLYLFEIEDDYHRVGEDGRWFFRDMNGMVDLYLWFGSPYQVLQTAVDDDGIPWQEIQLPDGSLGWLKGQ